MRKQLLPAKQLEDAKTLASDFQTDWVKVDTADNVGFFINCNNITDNTGTFAVQVRPWRDENTFGDPVSLTLSSTPTLADGDDDFFVNLNQLPNCQIRVAFTSAGGTPDGDCDIWISATGA